MSSPNTLSGLIPRGSLGLKLLLVCALVLVMGIPLLLVGALVSERQARASNVTAEIGAHAGGSQNVGGPMLLVPYERAAEFIDEQGRATRRTERGSFIVFADAGSADATLVVTDRRLGIYRAAVYSATADFDASFRPADALAGVDASYRFDWAQARIVMFVSDSRAIRNAAQVRFPDGTTATFEPVSDLSIALPGQDFHRPGLYSTPAAPLPANLQAFAAPARLSGGPRDFSVETRLELTGAQRFSIAAFAQDTSATIRGDRRDARGEGYFQSNEALTISDQGFVVSWRVPFVARGIEKAADLGSFNLGGAAARDMAVTFVGSDNIYRGVARAARYGIMFIGIVFLATLIFEAVSGKKAHPAQYVLVGLAQCVFYLLLLALTELFGFTPAFIVATAATIFPLAYYAGESFRSPAIGLRTLLGLGALYVAMYVLMTLEDYALLAGTVVTWAVIVITLIVTRRIDWYGRASGAESK